MRHRERGTRTRPPGQDPSGPEAMLDALLDGGPLPGEDQAGLQPVADVLAALRAPASPAELTGETRVLAEFRAQPQYSARAAHSPRSAARAGRPRQPARARRGPLRPRPAMAFAAGAAVLAGLAAGAYAGDLPGPVEKLAHTIGLTTHRPTPSASHTRPAATPDATPDLLHHHRTRPAQLHPSLGRHTASHDRDGHQHDGQQGGQGPGPTGGHGGSASPSASATPEPSTSPAAQPSPQSSTSPASPHQHSSSSSPP